MARTKRPAVKGKVYTVEELNYILIAGQSRMPGGKLAGSQGPGKVVRTTPAKAAAKPSRAAKWDAVFADVKAWILLRGRYPRSRSSDTVERSLYNWLNNNLPGKQSFLPERWDKLNNEFGEGWEHSFRPGLISGQVWNRKLVEVKEWIRQKGRYPRLASSDAKEKFLNQWLASNLPTKEGYRSDRYYKINDALGVGWEIVFLAGNWNDNFGAT